MTVTPFEAERAAQLEKLMRTVREVVDFIDPSPDHDGLYVLGNSQHADTIRRLVSALAASGCSQDDAPGEAPKALRSTDDRAEAAPPDAAQSPAEDHQLQSASAGLPGCSQDDSTSAALVEVPSMLQAADLPSVTEREAAALPLQVRDGGSPSEQDPEDHAPPVTAAPSVTEMDLASAEAAEGSMPTQPKAEHRVLPHARPPVPPIGTERQTLPNGMAGRAYSQAVALAHEKICGMSVIAVRGAEEAGLQFDSHTSTLSGTPVAAGDYEVAVTATVDLDDGKRQRVEWTGVLTIVPDPRSLWRDVPSDKNDVFAKPDADIQRQVRSPHLLIAASKRGRSHAHIGKFRDDDVVVTPLGKDESWHLLAVADGAGSAEFSRRGSEIAVHTVSKELDGLIAQRMNPVIDELATRIRKGDAGADAAVKRCLYGTLVEAAFRATKAIEQEAQERGLSARQFATTLIVVVHRATSVGHFVAGFGIGDGGAALLDFEHDKVRPLMCPDAGEFAGQTRFLASAEFAAYEPLFGRIRYELVDRFSAVVAMTDGVTDPKFPVEADLASVERWRDFWERDLSRSVRLASDNADAGKQLLDWLDFWSPGNHDDRTIAILV